jgi:hypothetical protein
VIKRPSRIFTPGFGAGAVAGYAVMDEGSSIEDMRAAFTG